MLLYVIDQDHGRCRCTCTHQQSKQGKKQECAQSITPVLTVLTQPSPRSLDVLLYPSVEFRALQTKLLSRSRFHNSGLFQAFEPLILILVARVFVHAPTPVQTSIRSLERFRPPTFDQVEVHKTPTTQTREDATLRAQQERKCRTLSCCR